MAQEAGREAEARVVVETGVAAMEGVATGVEARAAEVREVAEKAAWEAVAAGVVVRVVVAWGVAGMVVVVTALRRQHPQSQSQTRRPQPPWHP